MNYQQTSCDSCGNTDCQSRKPGHFKETPEQVRKRIDEMNETRRLFGMVEVGMPVEAE